MEERVVAAIRKLNGAEYTEIEHRYSVTAKQFKIALEMMQEHTKDPGQKAFDTMFHFGSDRVCVGSGGEVLIVETKKEVDRIHLDVLRGNLVVAAETQIKDAKRRELLTRSALDAMRPTVATGKDAFILAKEDVEKYEAGEAPEFFDDLRWLSAGRGDGRVFLNTPCAVGATHLAFGEFVVRLKKGTTPQPAHAVPNKCLVPELIRSRERTTFVPKDMLFDGYSVAFTVVNGSKYSIEVEVDVESPRYVKLPASIQRILDHISTLPAEKTTRPVKRKHADK